MSLLLLLSTFTSLRLRAILESGCAKGSNRALQYRDVELILLPNPTPRKRDLWVMKVIFVFVKEGYQSLNP